MVFLSQDFIHGLLLEFMIQAGKPIQDISITEGLPIDKIFEKMSKSGGFESRNLADGLLVLTDMIDDDNCLKFCRLLEPLYQQD